MSSDDWPAIVAISGGHLTPALATIEQLQKQFPKTRIVFFGREYSQELEKQPAKERELCGELGIPFFALPAPKFHRRAWWRNLNELPKVFPALWKSWQLLRQEKVELFLSFGGYLAVPIAFSAWLRGIPVVTHEQTRTTGLANELIALFATKIAISYPESRAFYPKNKVELTGNPLRASLLRTYTRPPSWLPESKKPVLYITGGSQGSQVINSTIGQILEPLCEKFLVVHQCGQSAHHRYLLELEERASALTDSQRASYVVREWMDAQEVSWLFQHAALVVSRSGANTTQEIAVHAVPAVFIPLPFAHNDEQTKNAHDLVEAGGAILLEQSDLSPESLLDTLQTASAQRAYLRRRAEKLRSELILDGAKRLCELCLNLLRSHRAHPRSFLSRISFR